MYALFELHISVKNNKHPNFEWRERGGLCIVLSSEATLFEVTLYNFGSDCGWDGGETCPNNKGLVQDRPQREGPSTVKTHK